MRIVEMQEKWFRARPMQFVVTFCALALVLFSFEAKAVKTGAKPIAAVEERYKQCVARAHLPFTSDENSRVEAFRLEVFQSLTELRARVDAQSEALYATKLADILRRHTGDKVTARTFERFQAVMTHENLRREVALSVGLQNPNYRYFERKYITTMFLESTDLSVSEKGQSFEVRVTEIEKARSRLLKDMIYFYQQKADRDAGFLVPTFLTPQQPSRIRAAEIALNAMTKLMHDQAILNYQIQTDRQGYLKAASRQAVLAAGGFGILLGTIAAGPWLVTAGGASVQTIGMSALIGEMGAGMLIGSAGGAAAEGVKLAYQVVSEAYYRSVEKGTPLSCELEKATAYADESGAFLHGAAMGASVGAAGTTIAAFLPRLALWAMGGAVAVGQTFETGSMICEGYWAIRYFELANEVLNVQVPADIKPEHQAIVRAILTEARNHGKKSGQHAVNAIIVGTLTKAFFWDREFFHSMHSGAQAVKGMAAYSSDTLPSAGMSVTGAAVSVIKPVAVSGTLIDQAQVFMSRYNRTRFKKSDDISLNPLKYVCEIFPKS